MDKNIILPVIFYVNLICTYTSTNFPTLNCPSPKTHFNFSATHNLGVTLYVDMNLFDLCPASD